MTRSRDLKKESVNRFKIFMEPKQPEKQLDCPGCIYLKRCLKVGTWPCQYIAFSFSDHIIGRMNAVLLIGRCIFWEPLGIKIRHVLRLLYAIVYWRIQIGILATGVATRDFLKRVHEHRLTILLAWNMFITSILVLIIAFLVLS